MSRVESLDRHQFPPQSILEKDEDAIAIVPVPQRIFRLPVETRTKPDLVVETKATVVSSYNKDMEYYLDMLGPYGGIREFPILRGYERFNDDWQLSGKPDGRGCLQLNWNEDSEVQTMRLADGFYTLYNQIGEDGKFYSPSSAMQGGQIEIMYRNNDHPDVVWSQPEEMSQFGNVNVIGGVATVGAMTYRSESYYENLAKTLLLRNFTVAYLNRLLDLLPDA